MAERRWLALVLGLLLAVATSSVALATGTWSPAQRVQDLPGTDPVFNTDGFLDGCPFIAPDGKMLFMASNRPGGLGGIDIYVSVRASSSDPWGPALNVGTPVNSEQNDFCPTLALDGQTFMFVSNRPGFCGGTANADMYLTRLKSKKALVEGGAAFDEVHHLRCDTDGGPNSGFDEASPFPQLDLSQGIVLYFSSTRSGNGDIYLSRLGRDGFKAAAPVAGLNTDAVEGQPNVRADGKEIFFFSNRPPDAQGNDIYTATRSSFWATWGTPVNLGTAVNSPAADTRPSLSLDGHTLYFGSTRTGAGDIYMTTR